MTGSVINHIRYSTVKITHRDLWITVQLPGQENATRPAVHGQTQNISWVWQPLQGPEGLVRSGLSSRNTFDYPVLFTLLLHDLVMLQ